MVERSLKVLAMHRDLSRGADRAPRKSAAGVHQIAWLKSSRQRVVPIATEPYL
jgi:hypothetical protein